MGTVILVGGMIAVVLAVILRAVAGKSGWWRANGQGYAMRSWRLRISCTPIDITSFLSNGWSEFIAGFVTGEVSAQGFYEQGKDLTIGSSIPLSLGLGEGLALTVTITLLDYTISTAVDRAAEIEISGRTNGQFVVVPVVAA